MPGLDLIPSYSSDWALVIREHGRQYCFFSIAIGLVWNQSQSIWACHCGSADLFGLVPLKLLVAIAASLLITVTTIIGIMLTLGCKHIRHVVQLLLIDLHLRNNQTKTAN